MAPASRHARQPHMLCFQSRTNVRFQGSVDAPRWLRFSAALACATAWAGFREAAALRAEGHEGVGDLAAATKRDLTAPRVSSLQQQRVQQEASQEQGAGATSSIDGKSSWKKALATGAAVNALASGGGVEAFQLRPLAEAAGVRGKAALDLWGPTAQFMGGGTVIGHFEPPPFSIMTFPSEKAPSPAELQMMVQQQSAWREQQFDTLPDTRVRIGPKLGNGAYAEVFVGTYYPDYNPQERIPVAVKKLPRNVETEREAKRETRMMLEMDMYRQEMDARKWPFLKFYGFEEHLEGPSTMLWVVMELADGHLESMVMKKTLKQFGFLDRMSLIVELTRAVSIMNQKGFIHRDVKPNNIFLKQVTSDDGEREYMLKLGDFGLACAVAGDSKTLCLTDMERNEFSNIGVPLYMSRERFMPQFSEMLKPGPMAQAMKCDVFSIGMILYQLMFLGRAPLAFFKHHGPPTEEHPSGMFDGIAWANDFDLRKDPVFRHARTLTQATDGKKDDENVVISEVLNLMEVMLSQDIDVRPFAVEVYKQGFEHISLAIEAARGYLGGTDELNNRVAQRIGDILESASTDPEVERMMGKPF